MLVAELDITFCGTAENDHSDTLFVFSCEVVYAQRFSHLGDQSGLLGDFTLQPVKGIFTGMQPAARHVPFTRLV